MNPWTLLLWVVVVALCLIIAALAAGLVGVIVRTSRRRDAGGDYHEGWEEGYKAGVSARPVADDPATTRDRARGAGADLGGDQ